MKNLLIIGYLWPEPASSAAGSRMMQLIDLFREKDWEITYASPASNQEFSINLAELGIEKKQIKTNDSSFDEYLKAESFTAVMFDRFMMEEQFGWRVSENCPNAIRILDTEDLHFFRKARYEAFKQGRSLKKTDLHSDEARREIASILRCDLSLIISEAETQLLIEKFNIQPSLLRYIPFLVEEQPEDKLAEFPTFQQRNDFMFIGNFLHAPNWDAVLYLKNNIWPLVKKQLPKAKLHIYGAYTTEKVKQLENKKEGFLVEGRVNNAAEKFQQTRILLAPLRFGAGIKGKFIEAMINGTPSVTTTIGAEGICGINPWNGEIANDDKTIAEAAVTLYKNEKRWTKAQQFGTRILQNRFQKATFKNLLFEEIQYLEENLETHRSKNFMGSMLMHHTLKSTKYMALWIEAKNKLANQKND
ncbi:glycosyltransferase [Mesonia maritima]|uniref:Glycosyltransferase involved in cell wall biosynthesis n=2 Tax=Mesonia maritima TaxID=1793873 RepID=A0ABU1K9N2_9FLAO|nr:glycosyltransferase [Mesonia maritima]MDR6301960.1 glycosyltransferase involved in cell wall biosynthesis [Mesonia maritima]